jgi:hypothetical protein
MARYAKMILARVTLSRDPRLLGFYLSHDYVE